MYTKLQKYVTAGTDLSYPYALVPLLFATLLLAGCSSESPVADLQPGLATISDDDAGEGIDLTGDTLVPPTAPELSISAQQKHLELSWEAQSSNSKVSLELYNRATRESLQLKEILDHSVTSYRFEIADLTFDWVNSEFVLSVCAPIQKNVQVNINIYDPSNCLRSYNQGIAHLISQTANQISPLNNAQFDQFGASISIDENAKVVVAGAPGREQIASSTQLAVPDAGAATLYFEVAGQWWNGAELYARNPRYNARFGAAVAIDALGNTIVVGSPGELNQNANENTGNDTLHEQGAAYMFVRAGETWLETQRLEPISPSTSSNFGRQIKLSGDASTLFINATTGRQNPLSSAEKFDGEVQIFSWNDNTATWMNIALLQGNSSHLQDGFGAKMVLSSDAQTLVISAPFESTGSEGQSEAQAPAQIDTQIETQQQAQGALYIYKKEAGQYTLAQKLDRNTLAGTVQFGAEISLSNDGNTLLSSTLTLPFQQNSRGSLLEKPQTQFEVYQRDSDGLFTLNSRLTPAGVHGYDTKLSLSSNGDGSLIAAAVVNSDANNNTVTLFKHENQQWRTSSIIENPGISAVAEAESIQTSATNEFAKNIALSADGSRLIVAAPGSNNAAGELFIY